MRERISFEVQYRIIWPDDTLHWVESKGIYQYDSKGAASRMLGVVMDITERKRIEDEIQRHNEYLRTGNEELARMNRAMVGRELRMVELKKEINELCGQAGMPVRYPMDSEMG
jgi:PAS domain-containing protein